MRAFIFGLLTHLLVAITGFGIAAAGTGPIVTSASLKSAPKLDGNADDWQNVPVVQVQITPANDGDAKNYTGAITLDVRSGTFGNNIYFFIERPDGTKDVTHKTLRWSEEKDGYVEGKDREDRLALKFDMGGDFYSCMLSSTEYKADMWHWKAYRSQTAGIVHDKSHTYSFKRFPKAKKHSAKNGKEIWIARPSDKGDKLYKSQRPIDNIGESVPKYIVNPNVKGSVADIKSAAKWANGIWYVEMTRKLNTGHADDVSFRKGQTYKAAIAVFNHTGDDHHSTSPFVLDITNQ